MPLLSSLSLDSCIGVEILLSALQERLVVGLNHAAAANGNRPRRGVKLCPRLEALSIRSCQDVTFGCLGAVVYARNGITKGSSQEGGSDVGNVNVLPNGENIATVTREEAEEVYSREGSQGGNDVANTQNKVQTVRKIKPLKLRHTTLHTGLSSRLISSPTATMVSTLVAMREVLEPANIIYVRIADCKLVNRDQALILRDLGVVDVIWVGSV